MPMSPIEKTMLQEVYNSNKRIESALFGDEDANVEGTFAKVKRHDKQIRNHNKIFWMGTGALIVLEAIKSFFKDLF